MIMAFPDQQDSALHPWLLLPAWYSALCTLPCFLRRPSLETEISAHRSHAGLGQTVPRFSTVVSARDRQGTAHPQLPTLSVSARTPWVGGGCFALRAQELPSGDREGEPNERSTAFTWLVIFIFIFLLKLPSSSRFTLPLTLDDAEQVLGPSFRGPGMAVLLA